MSELIAFVDDYATDDRSIEAAANALQRSEPVGIAWPPRTAELLARKEEQERVGVHKYGVALSEARQFAAADARLPHLWRALNATDATETQARFALAAFARFANLQALRQLAGIQVTGETPRLEEELRAWEDRIFYNSPVAHSALGSDQPIYTVDVEVVAPQKGRYYYAPASLISGLAVGDKARGELLICWIIPQAEVHLLGQDIEPDYRDLTLWHVRDDEWGEGHAFKHYPR